MIELRHFRHFVAVAEELSLRRAAERIHIDQTPLSRTIRDLEEQLGVCLFIRSPRSLRLTPAGMRLLSEARKIFVRVDRAARAARETGAIYRMPLRIAVADEIAQPRLSACLTDWRQVAAEIPFELTEMRAPEMVQALERGLIDVGFSFGVPVTLAVAQQPVWSYSAVALLPSGHELASKAKIAIRDLLAFPLISYDLSRQPGLSGQLHLIFGRHQGVPEIAGEASTLNGYVTRVAAGMGLGIGDAGHAGSICRPDVVVVPLEENELITTYVLFKQSGSAQAHAVNRFVSHSKKF